MAITTEQKIQTAYKTGTAGDVLRAARELTSQGKEATVNVNTGTVVSKKSHSSSSSQQAAPVVQQPTKISTSQPSLSIAGMPKTAPSGYTELIKNEKGLITGYRDTDTGLTTTYPPRVGVGPTAAGYPVNERLRQQPPLTFKEIVARPYEKALTIETGVIGKLDTKMTDLTKRQEQTGWPFGFIFKAKGVSPEEYYKTGSGGGYTKVVKGADDKIAGYEDIPNKLTYLQQATKVPSQLAIGLGLGLPRAATAAVMSVHSVVPSLLDKNYRDSTLTGFKEAGQAAPEAALRSVDIRTPMGLFNVLTIGASVYSIGRGTIAAERITPTSVDNVYKGPTTISADKTLVTQKGQFFNKYGDEVAFTTKVAMPEGGIGKGRYTTEYSRMSDGKSLGSTKGKLDFGYKLDTPSVQSETGTGPTSSRYEFAATQTTRPNWSPFSKTEKRVGQIDVRNYDLGAEGNLLLKPESILQKTSSIFTRETTGTGKGITTQPYLETQSLLIDKKGVTSMNVKGTAMGEPKLTSTLAEKTGNAAAEKIARGIEKVAEAEKNSKMLSGKGSKKGELTGGDLFGGDKSWLGNDFTGTNFKGELKPEVLKIAAEENPVVKLIEDTKARFKREPKTEKPADILSKARETIVRGKEPSIYPDIKIGTDFHTMPKIPYIATLLVTGGTLTGGGSKILSTPTPTTSYTPDTIPVVDTTPTTIADTVPDAITTPETIVRTETKQPPITASTLPWLAPLSVTAGFAGALGGSFRSGSETSGQGRGYYRATTSTHKISPFEKEIFGTTAERAVYRGSITGKQPQKQSTNDKISMMLSGTNTKTTKPQKTSGTGKPKLAISINDKIMKMLRR